MNYTELSERLQSAAGWSINAVGIRRIESGERRRQPQDDLMALALVLGITPITLLMPYTAEPTTLVEAAGIPEPIPAVALWDSG